MRKIFWITPRKQALKIVLKRQTFFWLPHPSPALLFLKDKAKRYKNQAILLLSRRI